MGREDSNKDGMIDILSQLLSYSVTQLLSYSVTQLLSYGLAMQKLMHNSLRY
ncbi:hypothetical protein [Arsenophonus sp.]|uniref:hypothetical protein n=1 Tax=Arsenophonus sp. TaxID=1872640 RepID=UPI0028652EF4|nr:hypothetical protein [Arsenophonus sp.]MDR5616634.1 hypothetical protein [Arsenophonus sp.]